MNEAANVLTKTGFPLGLENLETWGGILQTSTDKDFLTDYKSQRNSHKTLKKSGNFKQMLFIIFSDI